MIIYAKISKEDDVCSYSEFCAYFGIYNNIDRVER